MTHAWRFPRRTVLVGTGAWAGMFALGPIARTESSAKGRTQIPVVEGGQARAVVVVEESAAQGVQVAAATLVEYVAKSTGVTLATVTVPAEDPPAGLLRLYVGFAGPGSHPTAATRAADLARDGWLIAPCRDTVVILGSNEWGVLNGVHALLREALGIEWLMPTDLGEDVPQLATMSISHAPLQSEPAFELRMFSPLHSYRPLHGESGAAGPYPDQYLWAQRNGLQGSYNQPIRFHHNLHTLFPVAEFGATHPEYYPGGNPPAPGVVTGWQPAFTEPGTVDVAVSKIISYFDTYPEQSSFSLGVNDNGGFAEPEPLEPYYRWVNAVAEGVAAVHPDKWFGLLAYVGIESPPPFAVHSRVVPFVTQDRMAWASAAGEAKGVDLLTRWAAAASQVGVYDYVYGSPYVLPRVYPHLADTTNRKLRELGVVAQYAELYPNWGEGPKPWLRAKLLWEPDQDVDALLQEWYQRAVGAAAAPHLDRYYRQWEEFWTTTAVATEWFDPETTYQAFDSGRYLNAVTAQDLARSRSHVDAMLANPGTPAQQARAHALARAFEYYDTSALTYPRDVTPLASTQDAITLLAAVEDTWVARTESSARRFALLDAFKSDPLLVQPLDARSYYLHWGPWNHNELWATIDHLNAHEPQGGPVTDWLKARVVDETTAFVEFVKLALGVAAGTLATLTANSSFEDGDGAEAPPWFLWVADRGQLVRAGDSPRTGAGNLTAHALRRGGPAQTFPVHGGLLASRAHVLAPATSGYTGSVQFSMNLQDASGRNLSSLYGEKIPVAPKSGGWFTVTSLDLIPETVGGKGVAQAQYVLILNGFDLDPPVHVDDITVHQVG